MFDSKFHLRLRPATGLVVGAALLLLLVAGAPTSSEVSASASANVPSHSYTGLQTLLRDGVGKGEDQGIFELYQFEDTLPSAWIWATDDTRDGDGTEYWVYSDSFVHPGPDDDSVEIRIEYLDQDLPTSVSDFLDTIAEDNAHIEDAGDLVVHRLVVSDATP